MAHVSKGLISILRNKQHPNGWIAAWQKSQSTVNWTKAFLSLDAGLLAGNMVDKVKTLLISKIYIYIDPYGK